MLRLPSQNSLLLNNPEGSTSNLRKLGSEPHQVAEINSNSGESDARANQENIIEPPGQVLISGDGQDVGDKIKSLPEPNPPSNPKRPNRRPQGQDAPGAPRQGRINITLIRTRVQNDSWKIGFCHGPLSLYSLIVGSIFFQDGSCSANENIPLALILSGSMGVLLIFIQGLILGLKKDQDTFWFRRREIDENGRVGREDEGFLPFPMGNGNGDDDLKVPDWLLFTWGMILVGKVIVIIYTCVIVFQLTGSVQYKKSPSNDLHYCDHFLYLSAFILSIVYSIIFGFALLSCCVYMMVTEAVPMDADLGEGELEEPILI